MLSKSALERGSWQLLGSTVLPAQRRSRRQEDLVHSSFSHDPDRAGEIALNHNRLGRKKKDELEAAEIYKFSKSWHFSRSLGVIFTGMPRIFSDLHKTGGGGTVMWMSTSSLNFTSCSGLHTLTYYVCLFMLKFMNSPIHSLTDDWMCAGYHANQNAGSPPHLPNPLICLEQCVCRFDWSLILPGFTFWRGLCSYLNTYHITYWTAAMCGTLS